MGGTKAQVKNAVDEVIRLGTPEAVMHASAEELAKPDAYRPFGRSIRTRGEQPRNMLSGGHPVLRFSIEMALNDELERRALEGELAVLQHEWREAEELAAISDRLLVPESIRARLRALRKIAGRSG